jgi:hypothetical protein
LDVEDHMQTSALAASAVLAAFGSGVAWLVVKGRQAERRADFDRAVRARKAGWRYDGRREGPIDYRFAGGGDGIDWTMWRDSDRGDDSPTPTAHWLSANVRTPQLALVILGRRRFTLETGAFGRLLMGLASGVAGAATGQPGAPDKPVFYDSAVLLEHGRPSFVQRFAVAVGPGMPRDWLDEAGQQLIQSWPGGGAGFRPDDALEVNLGPRGLAIAVRRMPESMVHWEHLAALGQYLARRLAAASA